MLHNFDLWPINWSAYVLLNLVLALTSSATLIFIYFRHRYILIKSSIVVIAITHLLFQWPMTLYAGLYETWLPQPYAMVALVHGFVLIGLAGSALTFRRTARECWARLTTSANAIDQDGQRHRAIFLLTALGAVMAAVYLAYVPIQCTGLYALVRYPEWAPLMRAVSLKLLADDVPKYSLSLLASSVVPFMTAIVCLEMMNRPRQLGRDIGYVLLLLVAWLLAALSGAKGVFVYLALVVSFTVIWRRALDIPVVYVSLLLSLALVPAFIITFIFSLISVQAQASPVEACFSSIHLTSSASKEALTASFDPKIVFGENLQNTTQPLNDLDAKYEEELIQLLAGSQDENALVTPLRILKTRYFVAKSWIYVFGIAQDVLWQVRAVSYRAAVVPLEVGGWYVHYEQTHGPLGIGAIPRLAMLFGQEVIDGPNLIGRVYGAEYYGHPVQVTISAGAGYLFSNFGYLGYWSLIVNLLLLWLLDVSLFVYRLVPKSLLVPLVATLTLTAEKFQEAEYGVVWLTHGFGVVLILALALTIFSRMYPPAKNPVHA